MNKETYEFLKTLLNDIQQLYSTLGTIEVRTTPNNVGAFNNAFSFLQHIGSTLSKQVLDNYKEETKDGTDV